MSARIAGGITFLLDDGPIRTEYSRGFDGKQTARLILGKGSDEIAIAVSDSPSETLALLEEKVAELRAWQQRPVVLAGLSEVAA